MSASTELLLESINALEKQIAAARGNGESTVELESKLATLRQQFSSSSQALNEAKVLKG